MKKGLFNFTTEKEVFILLIKYNTSYISSNRYSLRSNAKCTSDCSTSTANKMKTMINTVSLNNEQKQPVKRMRFDKPSSSQATRKASKAIDASKQNNGMEHDVTHDATVNINIKDKNDHDDAKNPKDTKREQSIFLRRNYNANQESKVNLSKKSQTKQIIDANSVNPSIQNV